MGKLTSETRYVGSAWYQKEVEIPELWKERKEDRNAWSAPIVKQLSMWMVYIRPLRTA